MRHVVYIMAQVRHSERLLLHSLLSLFEILPFQPLPQPPLLMASSHQNIDIPHSSLANDEAASGVDVEGGCYHLTFAVWALLTKTLPSVTRLLARLVGPVSDPQLQILSTLNRTLHRQRPYSPFTTKIRWSMI